MKCESKTTVIFRVLLLKMLLRHLFFRRRFTHKNVGKTLKTRLHNTIPLRRQNFWDLLVYISTMKVKIKYI